MTIEIQGIDAKSGLDLCGDEEIYLKSLHLYVSSIPATLEKIRSVSAETLQSYAISVHGLKGMSEYIGAEETRKTAKELETMSKNGDLAGVLAMNDAFIKQTQNLVNNIQSWLNNNKT